jgi:hypothetical protein
MSQQRGTGEVENEPRPARQVRNGTAAKEESGV